MAATPQQYFEASERYGYNLFSSLATRVGRDASADTRSTHDGVDEAEATYNPIRITQDFMGTAGMWDVLLHERIERLATPQVFAGRCWTMIVRRSLRVVRFGSELGPGIIEEIIDRPPVYRFRVGGVPTTEIAAAEVEFGNPEPDLQNQARYLGWLGAALEAAPQLAVGR